MTNLEDIAKALSDAKLPGQLWIDGSFLTKKVDPRDVDVVFHARADDGFDPQNSDHRKAIDWLTSNLKQSHLCDSYVNAIPPASHPLHPFFKNHVAYWQKQFGYSRSTLTKGIVVVEFMAAP
jgi:hypothetical protein